MKCILRIRCNSNKMGKYGKQERAPRKLKWTNIPNDDAASKLCATDGKLLGKRTASSEKTISGKLEKMREK